MVEWTHFGEFPWDNILVHFSDFRDLFGDLEFELRNRARGVDGGPSLGNLVRHYFRCNILLGHAYRYIWSLQADRA